VEGRTSKYSHAFDYAHAFPYILYMYVFPICESIEYLQERKMGKNHLVPPFLLSSLSLFPFIK
jgi:hypothetical protein